MRGLGWDENEGNEENWDQCWCRCEASPPTLESPAASASQSPLHTGGECYGENEEEEFKKKKKKKEFHL